MPLQSYDQQLPDPPLDAPLWRFMPMMFFQDLMANEELYLRRCDKIKKNDPLDGLPTPEYMRKIRGFRRYDVRDERNLIAEQGSNRLFTEMYYLSCWNLYKPEHEMQMWQQYADNGVAVQTTFGQLQKAVDQFPDKMHMGRVRYGDQDMTGNNLLQFLFTKGRKFLWESEVRIALFAPDPKGGQARTYDEFNNPHDEALDHLYPRHSWVKDEKRRRFFLKDIITGIAISPWAPEAIAAEVKSDWASVGNLKLPVQHMQNALIPDRKKLSTHGGVGHLKPEDIEDYSTMSRLSKG